MAAGGGDAKRGHVPDATIVELYLDEEPLVITARAKRAHGRSRTLVTWGWIATLLIAPVGAVIGFALVSSVHGGVEMRDIERGIRADLSGQFLGDARVSGVRCVRHTQTGARCVAELFDKSGDGPIMQAVTVSIDQDSGDYFWHAGAAN